MCKLRDMLRGGEAYSLPPILKGFSPGASSGMALIDHVVAPGCARIFLLLPLWIIELTLGDGPVNADERHIKEFLKGNLGWKD